MTNIFVMEVNARKFMLSNGKSVLIVECEKIKYIEADGAYSNIYKLSSENYYTISKSLKCLEEILHKFNFFRCSKSILINLNLIKKIRNGNENLVIFEDDSSVKISARCRTRLLSKMRSSELFTF